MVLSGSTSPTWKDPGPRDLVHKDRRTVVGVTSLVFCSHSHEYYAPCIYTHGVTLSISLHTTCPDPLVRREQIQQVDRKQSDGRDRGVVSRHRAPIQVQSGHQFRADVGGRGTCSGQSASSATSLRRESGSSSSVMLVKRIMNPSPLESGEEMRRI